MHFDQLKRRDFITYSAARRPRGRSRRGRNCTAVRIEVAERRLDSPNYFV